MWQSSRREEYFSYHIYSNFHTFTPNKWWNDGICSQYSKKNGFKASWLQWTRKNKIVYGRTNLRTDRVTTSLRELLIAAKIKTCNILTLQQWDLISLLYGENIACFDFCITVDITTKWKPPISKTTLMITQCSGRVTLYKSKCKLAKLNDMKTYYDLSIVYFQNLSRDADSFWIKDSMVYKNRLTKYNIFISQNI